MSQATIIRPAAFWNEIGSTVQHNKNEIVMPTELDFQIAMGNCFYVNSQTGIYETLPKRRVILRTDTGQALGHAGTSWHPYTNKQMWTIIQKYCEQTKGTVDKAGFYKDFSFVVIKHTDYEVVKNDPITKYDMFVNPFQAGRSFTLINTDIRIACGNALTAALSHASGVFRIRHAKNIADQIQIAAEASAAAVTMRSNQIEFLETLTKHSVSTKDISEYANKIFKITDKSSANTLAKVAGFKLLVENGLGADIKHVNGTLYGLYQAAVEFADHYLVKSNKQKFQAAISGNIANFKKVAKQEILQLVA